LELPFNGLKVGYFLLVGFKSYLKKNRTPWIDLNGIGIIEEYQRLGGTAILIDELYKSIMNFDQYHFAELLQFREENIKILLEVGNFDIDFHKIHRLYEKYL